MPLYPPPSTGGGGGMAIGGSVAGGTAPAVLFEGPGGVLAQDPSNFGWDDTHDALLIQGQNALYRVPNGLGDNWFDDGAGNFTVTGYNNFGTGGGALANVTSGNSNVAVGQNSLLSLTTGARNFCFGTDALKNYIDGTACTAVGVDVLKLLQHGGAHTAIGDGTMENLGSSGSTEQNNTGLGFHTFGSLTTGSDNTGIGWAVAGGISSGGSNVILGSQTLYNASGLNDSNTIIGKAAMYYASSVNNCTIIGQWNASGANYNNIIAINYGYDSRTPVWDWGLLNSNTTSYKSVTGPQALHVYNTYDNAVPTVNFERGVFDWNITSNVLTIGTPPSGAGGTGVLRDTVYYSAGIPGLYRVHNASGDNWFEGGAGNFTLTGYSNFGTGPGCLSSLTTGYLNMAIGPSALAACTTGFANFAVGANALAATTTGGNNTAVGTNCMPYAQTCGNNIAIGNNVLTSLGYYGTNEQNNVGIGVTIANGATSNIGNNVLIGTSIGLSFTNAQNNVAIGTQHLHSASTAQYNTILGYNTLYYTTAAYYNTIIGSWNGPAATVYGVIGLTDGNHQANQLILNYNYTKANVWSMHLTGAPQGLHIYNAFDDAVPSTNYERLCLDWTLTSNVARLAMQNGGTGVNRIIAIDGFAKAGAPVAGDLPAGTFGLIDDTSGGATWLCFNHGGTLRKVQLT